MTQRRRACGGAPAALFVGLSLALAGCGEKAQERLEPRAAAAALMERLANADARGVCRSLSARAQAELARDFGGSSCSATAAAAARYVRDRAGLREAVRGVRILPTSDIPLSPAPQRAGTDRVALRLVVDDPVLGSRQAFDIVLRRIGGRWRVDGGIAALFTIVRGRPGGASASLDAEVDDDAVRLTNDTRSRETPQMQAQFGAAPTSTCCVEPRILGYGVHAVAFLF